MLLFERDIYPAFTSGEPEKITAALDLVLDEVRKGSSEADVVFRLFNWSWPALTAKARTNSAEGLAVTERFVTLMTALISNCSRSLLPQMSNCKLVLRTVIRGLNTVDSSVAVSYLEVLTTRIVPEKTTKGFFLDRVAMDHIVNMVTEAGEVGTAANDLLLVVLKSRRLYNMDQIVDILVRVTKLRGADAVSARICRQTLNFHSSRHLYESLMDKLGFLSSENTTSSLKRLTVLNFLIQAAQSKCQGDRIPACIKKSEITLPIINWKANKLIAIFTMRLIRTILSRIDTTNREEYIRDRMIEINSIVPVLKQMMTTEGTSALLVSELCSVVLEYKRALPGSFNDCKFDWTKLLEDETSFEIRDIVVSFVFGVHKNAVPLTSSAARMWSRVVSVGPGETVAECAKELLTTRFGAPGEALVYVLEKEGRIDRAIELVGDLVRDPIKFNLINHAVDEDLASKVEARIAKLKKRQAKRTIQSIEESEEVVRDVRSRVVVKASQCEELWREIEASGGAIDIVSLVGSDKLCSAILALSSENDDIRWSGLQVLAVVLRALAVSIEARGVETSRFSFREAPQIAMILTWLRNGISPPSEGQWVPERIPLVASIFVIEAIKVLLDPASVVYTPVYKYVVSGFAMRVSSEVAMWSELFFAQDAVDIRPWRLWILDVISKSVSDPVSIELLMRRGVFESLLDASINLNSTAEELDLVVDIVQTAVSHKPELVKKYALCQWIYAVSNSRYIKFLD